MLNATSGAPVQKYVCHGRNVLRIAHSYGWLPGARYTNLRDAREFDRLGFLDIDWRRYCFKKHLAAARSTRPILTVARDIVEPKQIRQICDEAEALAEHAERVVMVPKAIAIAREIEDMVPARFILGYSVPST